MLEIRVTDEVVVHDFTAPRAVRRKAIKSPYFQPEFTFKVSGEVDWSTTKPRGPCVTIDMSDLVAAFE